MTRTWMAIAVLLTLSACTKSGPCPKGMSPVDGQKVCVDRWESSAARDGKGALGPAVSREGALPADSVSWLEADASCRAAEKRLCTSAEWVAACRGSEGRRFPYGAQFDEARCNTLQSGRKAGKVEKRPAGSFKGCDNGRGVMDLSGNVWEWTATADRTGDLRQLWGGGYANDNHEDELTCGFRKPLYQPPHQKSSGVGYRCCTNQN